MKAETLGEVAEIERLKFQLAIPPGEIVKYNWCGYITRYYI